MDLTSQRQPYKNEQQAYKNLEEYDLGVYTLPSLPKMKSTTKKIEDFYYEKEGNLNVNLDDVNNYLEHGLNLNKRHSNFKPGIFAEKGSYEASFAKKNYYNAEIEFIIRLFISHNNIHAFSDGNKRTALNLFLDLLHKYTAFYISDIIKIQEAQLLYVAKKLKEDDFISIILNEVNKRVVKLNTKCHLEHLIDRVVLDKTEMTSQSITQADRKASFTLSDLEQGQFFYQQLKKPYFQRDTNQWSIARVEQLIKTFLDDALIPAIILWESNDGEILIIDGAHRISSLIAWVNDNYGEVNLSSISNHQEISEYFNNNIGNYNAIKTSKKEEFQQFKKIIAKKSVPIQWVIGDYQKVKESFIRINEQGVTLSNDEKELIENDMAASSQLARAILSHGTGQHSSLQTQKTEEIFSLFFQPTLIPNNTIYPMMGALDEDLVISKVYNVVKILWDKKEDLETLTDKVLHFARFSQEYLQISNKVYFYGSTQRYKTSSLFGMTLFIHNLMQDTKQLKKFTKNRAEFENFLINNESNVQDIARKRRQASNAFEDIADYYKTVLDSIDQNNIKMIYDKFTYLSQSEPKLTNRQKTIQFNYQIFIQEIPQCSVCHGFIDGSNKTVDLTHKICETLKS